MDKLITHAFQEKAKNLQQMITIKLSLIFN